MDDLIDDILNKVEAVAASFAREVAESIRDDLTSAYPPASTPGMPPHMRTGQLITGIEARSPVREGDVLTIDVASTAPYSSYLEFGTDRMEPRPFMQPAYERSLPDWIRTARAAATRR